MYWMSKDGFVTTGKPLAAEAGSGWREVIPVVVGSPAHRLLKVFWGDEDAAPPSPAPLRRGERVKWWRGGDSGTGTYWSGDRGWEYPHLVALGDLEDEIGRAHV